MALILFEPKDVDQLYPLAITHPMAELRVGILSFKARWEMISGLPVYLQSRPYLQEMLTPAPHGTHLWLDASLLPDENICALIMGLKAGEALVFQDQLIAGKSLLPLAKIEIKNFEKYFSTLSSLPSIKKIRYPSDLLGEMAALIQFDIQLIRSHRKKISTDHFPSSHFICPEKIFIEEGASIEYSYINARNGPVFISKKAKILAGCLIQGPFVLGEASVLKMGTKIYGPVCMGTSCIAGGEIKNSLFMDFSNKAHEGYLGDSVIGNWCNLGAGTSVSNVKNTAGNIRIAGLDLGKKAGVLMGDYSRTAINTSVNTGTVIGLCSHVFGAGLTPKKIPDFSWGFPNFQPYDIEKAIEQIAHWKSFKNQTFTEAEKNVLKYIFAHPKINKS